jgi:hypothetical protein
MRGTTNSFWQYWYERRPRIPYSVAKPSRAPRTLANRCKAVVGVVLIGHTRTGVTVTPRIAALSVVPMTLRPRGGEFVALYPQRTRKALLETTPATLADSVGLCLLLLRSVSLRLNTLDYCSVFACRTSSRKAACSPFRSRPLVESARARTLS